MDGGEGGGTGGSLTKIGTGTLTLGGATYTGGTIVSRGLLLANSSDGSATGTGTVQVMSHAELGGVGISAVTIGTGSGQAAYLTPGSKAAPRIGTLTIESALTFTNNAIYEVELTSRAATADTVVASGVTIASVATVVVSDHGGALLPTGTVLTLISNTSPNLIVGSFANLADDSIVTVGVNNFKRTTKVATATISR